MTTVTMWETPDIYAITAEGHATGSSEVCAAVSMMITSAANWTLANGFNGAQILESGKATVQIPKEMRGAKTIFNLLDMGFDGLEKSYGDFFKKNKKKVQSLGRI